MWPPAVEAHEHAPDHRRPLTALNRQPTHNSGKAGNVCNRRPLSSDRGSDAQLPMEQIPSRLHSSNPASTTRSAPHPRPEHGANRTSSLHDRGDEVSRVGKGITGRRGQGSPNVPRTEPIWPLARMCPEGPDAAPALPQRERLPDRRNRNDQRDRVGEHREGTSGESRSRALRSRTSSRVLKNGCEGGRGLNRALAALADFDDRAVEDDVRVPFGQRPLLLDRVDLRVAGEQDRLSAWLPGQDRLRPQG
jgi:hypothetical protein